MFYQAKERFLTAKLAEPRGITVRTMVNYREALDQFFGFVLATNPRLALQEVRREDVEDFLLHLRELKRSDETRQNRFRTLRNFFNWCRREKLLRVSPMKGMTAPIVRPGVVKPYSGEEVDRLLAATRYWPELALRDQAMVALLYNTGLRAGELCTLKPDSVKEGALHVVGKGKKERWVGVEPVSQRLLWTYMASREGQRYVFNISVGGLYRVVRRLAWAAQPRVANAYVHRFRDSYAVAFLENGGDVEQLQTTLGHAKIETTLRYVQYRREQRAVEAQRRFAPFAAAS